MSLFTARPKKLKSLTREDKIRKNFDRQLQKAASKFSVPASEVTDAQPDEKVSDKALAVGSLRYQDRRLEPCRSPNSQLREILLRPAHQVIDKFTCDQLLTSSFDPEAETLVTSFRQFIEDNKVSRKSATNR